MEVIGRVESGTETESDAGCQSREPECMPIHEDSSTELTPLSRKKRIFRGNL